LINYPILALTIYGKSLLLLEEHKNVVGALALIAASAVLIGMFYKEKQKTKQRIKLLTAVINGI
jgi:membrane-bound ClpP family serine protease